MNLTLPASTISISKDERITRRQKTTFNRFLSFNENHHRSLTKSTSDCVDFLEEEKNDLNQNISIVICRECKKTFASKYGLNYHINMHHSNQSILCSECNITFRSHRTLKTHQQRFHSSYSQSILDYSHISSYLIVPFSSQQFPFIAKNACEQGLFPLGYFTSKLFPCEICNLSFPCSRTLKYHLLKQHEQYEYTLCKNILYDICLQIEEDLRTVNDDDDIESMKFILAKQASQFGLVDKQLAVESHHIKQEQTRLILPKCEHQNRTCANLCLNHLSSYDKLIRNYPYKILTLPKGNPFAQGSIVSKLTNGSLLNDLKISKEGLSYSQNRKSVKRMNSSLSDGSSSPQSKKKNSSNTTTIKQTNQLKSVFLEQSSSIIPSTSPRKIFQKDNHNYVRSISSLSSNSSTSTRSSSKMTKSLSTNIIRPTTVPSKRSLSPTITLAVERSSQKRRRQREQRKKLDSSSSSAVMIKIDDDIEQENDDDVVVPIKFKQSKQQRRSKQRQISSGSIEYVQILNNDQQFISSLNNIENLKSKPKINEEDIIICRSPPSGKNLISSPNKNQSKTSSNGIHNPNNHQASDNGEHVRVRCKVCDQIFEGRSRFSKHVLTMHSHLLRKNISDQKQQQTAIVR